MANECKSKGIFDTLLAETMGFQQNEIADMFGLARSTISKRMTAENEGEYNQLKAIMLEEAAREAGKLLARASFERLSELLNDRKPEDEENE